MSIYSNDNISKIAKLTTRELPHLAKTAKITVRENNGVYSRPYAYDVTEGRPPRVGGQTRHCHVRYRQACSQRANPCMPYRRAGPGPRTDWGWAPMRSASTTRARSATSLDPQHGVVVMETWRQCIRSIVFAKCVFKLHLELKVTFKRSLIIDDKSLPHKLWRSFTRLLIFKIKFSSKSPTQWLTGSAEMTPVIGSARGVHKEVMPTFELVD